MLLDPSVMLTSSPLKQIADGGKPSYFCRGHPLEIETSKPKGFINSKQDAFLIASILICQSVPRLRARQEDKEVYFHTAKLQYKNRLTMF